ncbi:CiaD-like domain-containing protein [Helicobacter pylori]|uniref:CiaD-like domain-containing protein n=1 Tax=Helicobacter pylori TaxID=210 RepID=UPI003F920EC1
MELKNIISETLNEIEKMAKTIDNGFNTAQKTPSFFKTPPHLQNTPNPKNANAPLESKNAAKIETQEKITEEKEEELKEIITEEITQKTPTQEDPTQETPTQVLIPNERVFLKGLLERTLVLFKGMQALEEKEALKRLDLVARFLQYQLSALEKRLESLERENTE